MTALALPRPDRAEWLDERRTYLGGSDIAAIVGMSPWSSPHQVWLQKMGAPEGQVTETEAMAMGTFMEPRIAELYAERTGNPVVAGGFYRDPDLEWIAGNPDYLDADNQRVIEIKNIGLRMAHEWGEEGTDEAPPRYVIQCLWYLGLTGYQEAHLAPLIGGQEFRIYPVPFDAETHAWLVDQGERFWHDYVLTEREPPLTGLDVDTDWVKKRFRYATESTVSATPEIDAVCQDLRDARRDHKEAEQRRTTAENLIKQYMGDSAFLETSLGSFSWKQNRDGSKVDWQAVALSLTPPVKLIEQHTKPVTGARVFRTPFKGD